MNGYSAKVKEFIREYENGQIFGKVSSALHDSGTFGSVNESKSWVSTLEQLYMLLKHHKFNDDAVILLEYKLPLSFRRIDIIFMGLDSENIPNAVIIEVKMWSAVKKTNLKDIIETFIGKKQRKVNHPSYQAWAYLKTMSNLLPALSEIKTQAAVWMTKANRLKMQDLFSKQYEEVLKRAPVYFNENLRKLRKMINMATCGGKGEEVMYKILNGPIKPAKKLMDSISSMLDGDEEFALQENQKIVYESILKIIKGKSKRKQVFVVVGGPGTGKSVLAVNLLAKISGMQKSCVYVSPNSSFRAIIKNKVNKKAQNEVNEVITGSAVFTEMENNSIDCVIVDEAQRLKDKRARGYRGENQIKDIIKAGKTSIFFVDEQQTIRPDDIGYVKNFAKAANELKAFYHRGEEYVLKMQMRCQGGDEYLRWIDAALQLSKENVNKLSSFNLKLADDPKMLVENMKQKIKKGYTCRLLAGKAWKWSNKINPDVAPLVNDVKIEEHGFALPWTTPQNPELWAVSDWGQYQVGSVHSAQGSEFDYAYVLIGLDLIYRSGMVIADHSQSTDLIAKRGYKQNPEQFNKLIKQTYRILMTRGMRGTMVYIRDPELKKYFENLLPVITDWR